MHPSISYQLATARIADLRRQAQSDALVRATTRMPPSAPQPDRSRIPVNLRRAARQRRFGRQLRTLLHAQLLLDGLAAAAGGTSLREGSYRRFAARRKSR